MKILRLFKKTEEKENVKKPELTKAQSIAKEVAIELHKRRIHNLKIEVVKLRQELKTLETDFDMSRVDREKRSDTIIRRLALLQYEIDTRKETIQWLSS